MNSKVKYFASIIVLAGGYYTYTYGKSLWSDDKNKLGGFGAILAAVLSTAGPILFLFTRP